MSRRFLPALGLLLAGAARAGAEPPVAWPDLLLHLDEAGPGWSGARVAADGFLAGCASFDGGAARIDAGPCPATSRGPFTLRAWIRTKEGGFSTPLMARGPGGGDVALCLVMGREPGRISFEAWSWQQARLVSTTRVDDGEWHDVEASYDPATRLAILSVDGHDEAYADLGEGGAPDAVLRLGNNIGADQPFRGDLDEVSLRRVTVAPARFALLAPVLPRETLRASLAALRDRLVPRATPDPGDAAAWGKRRAAIRAGVADAIGLSPLPERGPLDPRIHGSLDGDGFTVSRVSWASWPGYRATGWLWKARPAREGRRPALLSLHGHFAGGAIDPVEQARASWFARDGWVVLAPDTVHVEDVASGVSSIGAMTWDNVRALDGLASMPDVDPARIAATGASGGGQQTLYLMALEDRLAAAAPICMLSYWQGILGDDSAHCTCNHAPRVAAVADVPEIASVFAPRPAFVGTVTGDWTHEFPAHGLPEMRRVWRLLGHEDRLASRHRNEGHNYDRGFREDVHAFLSRTLLGDDVPASEPAFRPFPEAALLALGPPRAPPDAKALAREHVARRPRVTDPKALAPALAWRDAKAPLEDLGPLGGTGWRCATVRGGDGVPIPLLVRDAPAGGPADAPWVVAASPAGKASFLLRWPRTLAASPRMALVDPRFVGEWAPFAAAWRRNGLLLGCGEGYQQAHDLALVCSSLPGKGSVTLVGEGAVGVAAQLATRISPRIARVIATDVGPRFEDDGNRIPLCPEILRIGDIPAGTRGQVTERTDDPGWSTTSGSLPLRDESVARVILRHR